MSVVRRLVIAGVGISAAVGSAPACPNCYGAPDSPMTAGMNAAILAMLGITGCVLLAIGAFILFFWRRSRRIERSAKLFVDEYGSLQSKDEKGVVEWNTF